MIKNKNSSGFTLVELLISLSVVGILIVGVADFYTTIVQARVKNQTVAEVERQGIFAMRLITQTIRNAENITSPTSGTSAGSLTLDIFESADDPTVIDSSNGRLRITEGTENPVFLTNTLVTLSNLTFSNLTQVSTPGIVRVSFTLTRANQTGTQEYDYAKTFTTSAALR